MRIKFKAPDPRAGQTVEMDSSRGQHFIDTGSAVVVKDSAEPDRAEGEPVKIIAEPPKPASKAAKKGG